MKLKKGYPTIEPAEKYVVKWAGSGELYMHCDLETGDVSVDGKLVYVTEEQGVHVHSYGGEPCPVTFVLMENDKVKPGVQIDVEGFKMVCVGQSFMSRLIRSNREACYHSGSWDDQMETEPEVSKNGMAVDRLSVFEAMTMSDWNKREAEDFAAFLQGTYPALETVEIKEEDGRFWVETTEALDEQKRVHQWSKNDRA